ncbi:MAG: response regulator transcription factor [Armatimonadota bacterium]|nr:response regulator transcription factor [Armatimonadota bacterium]
MAAKIRVVVADDEAGYRKALTSVLASAPDIELVGVAMNGREACDMVMENDASVLLTDIQMPRMNGLECLREIAKRRRETAVVILTVHEDDQNVFEAVRSGAISYLLKTSTPKEVLDAIRRAHDGETTLTPTIASKVLSEFRRQKDDVGVDDEHLYELSDREHEILEFIARGLRNRDIAGKLHLAEKTVKNHVSSILKALHVNSRTEAAMKALKERLVGS